MPLSRLDDLLPSLGRELSPGALLSDVVAVKVAVRDLVKRHLPGVAYVGAHPMAGGERGGYGRSHAELFAGASVAVCAAAGAEAHAARIAGLWQQAGARPVFLTAERHDQIAAATSELPYLSAVALIQTLATAGPLEGLFGRGLLDATRHAAFSPEIMGAAAIANPALPGLCRQMAGALVRLAELLADDGPRLLKAVRDARHLHDELLGR